MSTPRKLPEVAPCPCAKQCETAVAPWCNELWYVVSQCGFSGPQRSSERAAILAWNRRAPDGDAERRGAMAAVEWIARNNTAPMGYLAKVLRRAIERGEVLPATKKARKRT